MLHIKLNANGSINTRKPSKIRILECLNTRLLECLNTRMLEYANTWIFDYLNMWIHECGTNSGKGKESRPKQNVLKYYRALSSALWAAATMGRRASRYPASSYAITKHFYNLVNNMGHNGKFVRQMMSSSNRIRFVWTFACQQRTKGTVELC